MNKYIGALDQGTTSTRFIIFDHQGHIVGLEQKEHEQIFPKPGWVEHDPMEIWNNAGQVFSGALRKTGIVGSQLAAVGVTNQRETFVVWNKRTGKPYYNAIVWQCTRSHHICAELINRAGQEQFREKTGLPIATYFSGPKLKWLLDNMPEIKNDAVKGEALFGTIETWIIWNLTGGSHVTDVTNASRTMLMNLHTLCWDEEILTQLDIPRAMLPQIVPSSDSQGWGGLRIDDSGNIIQSGRSSHEIPVCGALGDQQAALVGQTCFEIGEAKNTYGTGCFLLLNTGEQPVVSQHGLLTTPAYQLRGQKPVYCLEGSIAVTGSLVQWLRDNLGLITSAAEIETLAKSVDDNGGVYFVPAFSGLFAPYWQADARGAIVGLTRYANKGHLARAVLEAAAYQTMDIVNAMNQDSGVTLTSLKADGGMVYNDLLMQFQADVLNVPVIRPKVSETTALGAAYAAGLAIGFWSNTTELKQNWEMDKIWKPAMPAETRLKGCHCWKKAVEKTFGWEEG